MTDSPTERPWHRLASAEVAGKLPAADDSGAEDILDAIELITSALNRSGNGNPAPWMSGTGYRPDVWGALRELLELLAGELD